ncbi:hypothetical protein [Acinetobacter sp. B51(2017)]|uniref:hypothetical protein n=1 Tax=Acinetobacter sp. B51(2017) TaxID=2060938 RepID=UPI000F07A746|nr:hypothetical protein [Acinetobacter sp. B51(2017)]
MKKLTVIKQIKGLMGFIVLLLFLGLGYHQFNRHTGQPLVRLADQDQQKLQQYQQLRRVKHYEFKLKPRQSLYCAGRIYCVEQSTASP